MQEKLQETYQIIEDLMTESSYGKFEALTEEMNPDKNDLTTGIL